MRRSEAHTIVKKGRLDRRQQKSIELAMASAASFVNCTEWPDETGGALKVRAVNAAWEKRREGERKSLTLTLTHTLTHTPLSAG